MRVSVLLPSRGRPASLRASIQSLRDMATDPREVEVLVGWDTDDPITGQVARRGGKTGLVGVEFPERHGYHQLHRYVNVLAERSAGDWLLLWNDDATMTTRGWDEWLGRYPAALPWVLSLASTGYGHALCCFPAVSRALYTTLGHLSLSPHIDTWLQDIGRATGTLRDIPVHVHHDRHDLTGGHDDQTRAESLAGYRSDEFYGPEMQALLRADTERIRVAWTSDGSA